MLQRCLGRTGVKLSVIGFGGTLLMETRPAEAAALVARAVERGINYFDVAPSYGNAEERLGPALEPYRSRVFLACKTLERSRDGAREELHRSLKRLRTDHVDLYQFHAVNTPAEMAQIFAPAGALEAVLDARDQGLVRHIGFSSHSEATALAMLTRFDFASVMFPVNWAFWHGARLGQRLLPAAIERGVAVIALKATARAKLSEGKPRVRPRCWYVPVETAEEAALGVRFALSTPATAAISASEADLLWWACEAAEKFVPLTPAEMESLRRQAGGVEPLFVSDVA